MNAISETSHQQHKKDDSDFSLERSLRALERPEHWTKGERHNIFPSVLSMCTIQVLNSIMGEEENHPDRTIAGSSAKLTSSLTQPRGTNASFGIGSIISMDDNAADSSGWFFADHHHQTTASVGGGGGIAPSRHIGTGHVIGGGNNNHHTTPSSFGKLQLGKATVAVLGMRSFVNEVYGWFTGVFVLKQNFLFEYREGDCLNGVPWGYAHLPLAEVYPHKHFTNALHLDFFEKPCMKSGKRSVSQI